ncbi:MULTISPECIES: DUF2550 domain-containing protein [unclassified Luteococcus]|uniref:DUF2550 domain-containing protein n=1 Tax=unclassified Luteococcus TaxID=2639923 RepID=UPI00313B3569
MLVLLVPLLGLYVRRRWLSTRGGVFDCALKLASGGWATGVARYEADELQWFRIFSLSTRPKLVLERDLTASVGHRRPDESEAVVLFSDDQIIRLRSTQGREPVIWELAMNPQSVTGLMSWLEAAPPGGDRYSGLA